ncbi:MAG: orotate phosphoribosyltransferase [Euryarchaeota archaeon]|nr:orotate phosphoribosyltransferase [Euryarchaeota archaeon]
MEEYKENFIEFLLDKGALKIGEFKLKSGRISPYFINTGVFGDGESIGKLGHYYAAKIMDRFNGEFDIIFGPSYKGIPLSVATTIALSRYFGRCKGYAFNRKIPKDHGEATKHDKQKSWIVGQKIEDGDKIIIIDDVLTTGGSKYESIELLNSVADNLHYTGLIIAVDREEIGEDGKNAIKEFQEKTKTPVEPIVTIREIIAYLEDAERVPNKEIHRLKKYLRKYGTQEAKKAL